MSTPVAGALATIPLSVDTGSSDIVYWDDAVGSWQLVLAVANDGSLPYLSWVPYTTSGQAFKVNNLTRDGDWTMVAIADTTDPPSPQPTGAEVDLLPDWAPTTPNARASYTVYNQWTLSTAGWVSQYGADILPQNLGATHVLKLQINGVVKDTFTAVPDTSGLYLHDITPIVVASGAVVQVTLSVTQVSNNQMYWVQQAGLFATAPTYTSLAQGSKDGAAAGTTAYGCHATMTPGTVSPNWAVVAYGGSSAGGGADTITLTGDVTGSGITTIPTTLAASGVTAGTYQGLTVDAKGRITAAANMGYVTGGPYLQLAGGTISGALTVTGTATLHTATATTPATADNSTNIATTAFVKSLGLGTGSVTSITAGTGLTGGTITTTGTIALSVPVSIANGGTGATAAAAALANLGGLPLSGGTLTGPLTVTGGSAGYVFTERSNSSLQWQWYANSGVGSLWNSTTGNVLSFTTAGTMTPVAGIAGVTNGSNAVAGNIGEYKSAILASPVALSYGLTQNPLTLTLGPGDWDVNGEVYIGNSVAFAEVAASISLANAVPSQPSDSSSLVSTQASGVLTFNAVFSTMRVSTNTNVNVYLNTYVTGSGGGPTFMGIIRARRVHP